MFDGLSYHHFGTPLPAIQKDEVPSKKPVRAEDQIVTDENGRRRFHGAFTGGFSAGYWNTVGSQEGWTPQNFKSSRKEKAAERLVQRPEDFMDDEDLGEFGIAPQRVQPRSEFATDTENRKRKLAPPSTGPIPGIPVLQQLLATRNDKVAERILKSMGWRPGQGVGPRQTRKEKKQARARNKREAYVMKQYGCEIAGKTLEDSDESSDASEHEDDDGITFAPDDIEPYFLGKIKDDRFGLGYTGLSRDLVLSKGTADETPMGQHINLFGKLEVIDKNKKLSISGQAFGVGALEEDDDDIYAKDDMTKYDFTLARKKTQKKPEVHVQDKAIIDGFVEGKVKTEFHEPFTVDMPPDFEPRNWAQRRSRFTPLDPRKAKELENQFKHIDLKRQQVQTPGRELYDEQPSTSAKAKEQNLKNMKLQEIQEMYKIREDKTKALLERISAKSSGFTKGGIITEDGEEKPSAEPTTAEQQDLLEKAKKKTKDLGADVTSGSFKPFMGDAAKQQRYDEFLAQNLQDDKEITDFLATIQPVHLSEWDREMEKKEFIQARKIYKPLGGIMSDRFVTESTIHLEKQKTESEKDPGKKIRMERTKTTWKPSALLCKRYNIAEPFGGHMVEEKKPNKPRMSVFDYLETSMNKKSTFQTPVIVPKHIEKPKKIIQASEHLPQPSEPAPKSPTPIKDTVVSFKESVKESKESVKKPNKEFVPKTELEKRVIESQHKPVHEKLELFKAIFDDSDEDEAKDSNEVKAPIEPTEPKVNPAAVANLLRNTSPPRGIFAALFTLNDKSTKAKEKETPEAEKSEQPDQKLKTADPIAAPKKDIETFSKITFKPRSQRAAAIEEESAPEVREEDGSEVYGPKIPDYLLADKTSKADATQSSPDAELDLKLLQLWQKHKAVLSDGPAEKWVEKQASVDNSSNSDSSSSSDHKKSSKKKKKRRDKKLKKKKSKTKSKKHGKSKKQKKK